MKEVLIPHVVPVYLTVSFPRNLYYSVYVYEYM